jgi:hypothetical protein
LSDFGTVDLATNLAYSQINNVGLEAFLTANGGIDGIRNLNGKTLVFLSPVDSEVNWGIDLQYSPLVNDPALNGEPGSYDSEPYAGGEEVPLSQRRDGWQII